MRRIKQWPTGYKHARLIGLGHRARQGKDLSVRLLQERFPGQVHRVAFADALYSMARLNHGMTCKDGLLLQGLGVEMRRVDPDVWVKLLAWRVADLDADADRPFMVCIPDVRFPNEAAFVKSHGGLLIRLQRLVNGEPYVDPSRPPDHISERALDGYPWPVTARVETGDHDSLRSILVDAVSLAFA